MIEATEDSYQLPDKGLVGNHAIFDPAALDVPAINEASWPSRMKTPGRCRSSATIGSRSSPGRFNPLDAQRVARGLVRGAPQLAGYPPADEPPLPPASLGSLHLRGEPVRGLHLRAASHRE